MEPEPAYLAELVRRLRELVGDAFEGVYVGGSYVLGDYERDRSDLDVALVVSRGLSLAVKEDIVANVRHEALPCPARGLELVVYRRGRTDFELNLNTGRNLSFQCDFAPVEGERHWFVIDRSILARHGIALAGPPAAEVFDEPERSELLTALQETLLWFANRGSGSASAVLNACRALRFAQEGVWSSKGDAGAWAFDRVRERDLVAEALEARHARLPLEEPRVREFLLATVDRLKTA